MSTQPTHLTVQGESVQVSLRRGRWAARFLLLLTLLGWGTAIVLAGMVWWAWEDNAEYYDTTHGVYEKYVSGNRQGKDKIAVVYVRGVIVDGQTVKRQLDRLREDNDVRAIVLRVETPGGTVYGSDYIYHQLCEVRDELELPIVVSMGSIAASGGYYVSMAVGDGNDRIFAEPATITGSIGVILPRYEVTGLMEKYDVVDDSIRSHPNKQMLSMTRSLDDEQRQLLVSNVNESFERFKSIILHGRPDFRVHNPGFQSNTKIEEVRWSESNLRILSPNEERNLATGEVFTASQALEYGLVDRIGFLDDAVERAAELAGISTDQAKVIRYARPKPLIELPTLLQEPGSAWDATTLTRPSFPHMWYIASPLPPLYVIPEEGRLLE